MLIFLIVIPFFIVTTYRFWMNLSGYDRFDFDGFDNETGSDDFIVPNIIHLIRFNQTEFSFVDYICIQSAFRNHGPDQFYIHTNNPPESLFKGKYWELVKKDKDLYSRINVLHRNIPRQVYGKNLSEKWRLWHGSDVTRLRILLKYGGIYLDNDVYVVHSLDKYRKFEATVNWDEGLMLSKQVIIANRNARILKLWMETYRNYDVKEW